MEEAKVTISNIDIPFGRMVAIILKWMLASIPAAILMWLVMMAIMLVFGGMFAGCAALM
jgi:hypothetical protein